MAMDDNLLIPKVIEHLMSNCGYCGSCIGGCDCMTKFICLGHTIQEVRDWIKENPVTIKLWEKEFYEG